jgi:hypothetical protein
MERFWQKVIKTDGCWAWTAQTDIGGYGRFWLSPRKSVAAHRYSYESAIGTIPEGLFLDHLCRVHSCVNPAHLEPVTNQENCKRGIAGMVSAKRQLAKKYCKYGHPYDEPNTYVCPRGFRECRTCRKAANLKYLEVKFGN